jgi:polyphosphate kinase
MTCDGRTGLHFSISNRWGCRSCDLRDAAWNPLPPPAFERHQDIFAAIRAGDVLVHHPYESFEDSVEHFIAAAAEDAETVAVKMTAYRIGDDTPFVKSLVKAAESGKQVGCVIEIKARFDEERNLHWAAELERAGAHVTFGVQGLKTHAKLALVVRKEASGLRSYVHIGTGNYHVRTARLYADVGVFTCNPEITRDVVNLFHYLTGHSQGSRSLRSCWWRRRPCARANARTHPAGDRQQGRPISPRALSPR